jgi:hypothetical protein
MIQTLKEFFGAKSLGELIGTISAIVAIIGAIVGIIRFLYLKRKKSKNIIQLNNNPLSCIWDCLDLNLQNAFSLVYNAKYKSTDEVRISTRDLFSAMISLKDETFEKFIETLPPDSLPKPMQRVEMNRDIIKNDCSYSGCISESIDAFISQKDLNRKISTLDMFVDIAINGRGSSVKRLRDCGIGPNEINEKIEEGDFEILKRKKN